MELPSQKNIQVSYLRVRDPSIISGHVQLNSVKLALADTEFQGCSSKAEVPKLIQVYLRIKKLQHLTPHYECNTDKTIICHVPERTSVAKVYEFDKIFESEATQEDLFNCIIKPKLFRFINGLSSMLLTYGASDSGKTFTIFGTATKPGIIPRAFEYLFRTLPHIPNDIIHFKPDCNGDVIFLSRAGLQEERNHRERLFNYLNSVIDTQHIQTYRLMQERVSLEPVGTVDHQSDVVFNIWISFAEIYNEKIYDLLKPSQVRARLELGTFNGKTFIKNLTSVNVINGLEAYQVLQFGLSNLQNAVSSSHSIFTITLVQGSRRDNTFTVSYFNFCDLAGPEMVNMDEKQQESSLHVLGKCIKILRKSQNNNDFKLIIPFRESKLTKLFQHALLGLEDIALIVNINPDVSVFHETQRVLGFSVDAREAKNTKSKERTYYNCQKEKIQKLRVTIISFQTQLEEQRKRHDEEETDLFLETLAEVRYTVEKHRKLCTEHLKDMDDLYRKEYHRKLEEAKKEYESVSAK